MCTCMCICISIHSASRGVAAHTAGLFRSVRGAKGGVELSLSPPVGAPQAREFSLFPPVGASQAREFSLFPAVTASQAMEFSLFPPPWRLSKLLDSPPNPVFFECVSMSLQWFPSKHGTLHFCRHKTGRKHHVRQCFQLGLPKLSNFHFSPPRGFPGENFHFSPPWRLPKLGNFRFSPP